jgi:hypothetical protein
VVTFPTKRDFVIRADGRTMQSAVAPFQRPFTAAAFQGVAGTACDEFSLDTYNREGWKHVPPTGYTGFPPPATPAPQNVLCSQANVLRFSYGGQTAAAVPLLGAATGPVWTTDGIRNGFAVLRFASPPKDAPKVTRVLVGSHHVYHGLPAVGFMLQTFRRDGLVVNGVPSTSGYGGNFSHKYERRIVPR